MKSESIKIDGPAVYFIILSFIMIVLSLIDQSIGYYEPFTNAIIFSLLTAGMGVGYYKLKNESFLGIALLLLMIYCSVTFHNNQADLTFLTELFFIPIGALVLIQKKTNIILFFLLKLVIYVFNIIIAWSLFKNPIVLLIVPLCGYAIFLASRLGHIRDAQKIILQNQEIEKGKKQLEEFAYVAAHDLKSPIRGIHHYAEYLEDDYKNDLKPEAHEMLEGIKKLSHRMENLVNELLNFSQIDKSKFKLKSVSLENLLNPLILEYKNEIQINNNQLPRCYVDDLKIEEVLRAIISNAVKFNKSENKTLSITYHPNKKQLQFSDNGIGIEEKNLPKVFSFFTRLHAKDEFGGGLGSGMSIVKKILQAHEIGIYIESKINEGTTIVLDLSEVIRK